MISKPTLKLIKSLAIKKHRDKENLFLAEGHKAVGDLLERFRPVIMCATEQWIARNKEVDSKTLHIVTDKELQSISLLQHPQDVIAVFEKPTLSPQTYLDTLSNDSLIIALDGIQDPGNLGTIIRIADWFGIETIVCSDTTVDCYNPKVIQATMGSLARVNVIYTDLKLFLKQRKTQMPIYGTLLDGDYIYNKVLTQNGIIIFGNEGNGISTEVRPLIDSPLLIPSFQKGNNRPDSLNVATAAAVVCSEFKRRF